uniref:Uncharacterized protein n=1 Tax=Globodera rostochiensis TaxID=31243 RepID=A0A914I3K1_GLORO
MRMEWSDRVIGVALFAGGVGGCVVVIIIISIIFVFPLPLCPNFRALLQQQKQCDSKKKRCDAWGWEGDSLEDDEVSIIPGGYTPSPLQQHPFIIPPPTFLSTAFCAIEQSRWDGMLWWHWIEQQLPNGSFLANGRAGRFCAWAKRMGN